MTTNDPPNPAWLIEAGSPPNYYCSPGLWCNNPNHAFRFESAQAARAVTLTMTTTAPLRVEEHMWFDGALE